MNYKAIVDKICNHKKLSEKEDFYFINSGNTDDFKYIISKIESDHFSIEVYSQLIYRICRAEYIDGLLVMIKRYVALDKNNCTNEYHFHLMFNSLVDFCKKNCDFITKLFFENQSSERECLGCFVSLLSYMPSKENLDFTVSCIDYLEEDLIIPVIHSLPSFSEIDQKLVFTSCEKILHKFSFSNETCKSIIHILKYSRDLEALSILQLIIQHNNNPEIGVICRAAIRSVKLRKSKLFRWLFNLNDSW